MIVAIKQLHIGDTEVSPEQVGYLPEKIEALNAHFAKLIEAGKLQGASYLLARHGKIFAQQALGQLRHTDNSPPLLTTSIRQTFSISKVFTATAIMQLVERGQLYLNQAVSTILPEFNKDMYKDITIFHLLTHTSGLNSDPGFFLEPYPLPSYDITAHKAKEHGKNWIETILLGVPANAPDKEWIYATSGFKLLNEIVQRVTGQFIDDYLTEEILKPLGMTNSYFNLPKHLHEQTLYTTDWQKQTLSYIDNNDENTIPRMGRGIYSTLEDLNKFAQMMLNKGSYNGNTILNKKTVELQTRNHLKNIKSYGWGSFSSDYKYGLGWAVDHFDLSSVGTYSHEGFGHSGMYIDPVEDFVYIFFVPSPQGFVEEAVVNARAIVWSGLI